MPRICEVCGASEEHEEEATASALLHVCASCIEDRAPYQHFAAAADSEPAEE